MPEVFREGQFRFRFYAGDRGEPPHIHVRHTSGTEAKFWLDEDVSLARDSDMRSRDIARAQRMIDERKEMCLEKWNDFFAE